MLIITYNPININHRSIIMHFIDSHLHLQEYKAKNTPQFLRQLTSCGLIKLICPSITEKDWNATLNFAQTYPQQVVPALGLHPWYLADAHSGWEERLAKLLQDNPHAIIGECGLDKLKNTLPILQKKTFAAHINLASQLQRPLLVHSVKSQDWLEDFWSSLSKVKFVLHSFGGSVEFMQRIVSFGGYISFAPSIRKRQNFKTLAQFVPLVHLLVESDGPFQGEPFDIPELLKEISSIKGISEEELSQQILQNTMEFINVRR